MMGHLFETERLLVRKFRPDDAQRLYEIHLEDGVRKWIPNESYADVEEANDAIRFFDDCVDQDHLPFVLAVELRETGELIGDVGVNEVEGKPEDVEIGYVICEKCSGKGYATELIHAAMEYFAAKFGIKTVYGRVMKGNLASRRVLEKNGYVFVKEEYGAEDDPYGKGMLVYMKEY